MRRLPIRIRSTESLKKADHDRANNWQLACIVLHNLLIDYRECDDWLQAVNVATDEVGEAMDIGVGNTPIKKAGAEIRDALRKENARRTESL